MHPFPSHHRTILRKSLCYGMKANIESVVVCYKFERFKMSAIFISVSAAGLYQYEYRTDPQHGLQTIFNIDKCGANKILVLLFWKKVLLMDVIKIQQEYIETLSNNN